jgi:DNA-binding IclR family transcriptional regulator
MACISTDGTLTESGLKMFRAMVSGPVFPEEVAQSTGLPMYRVRGGLRDLVPAGFVIQKGDKYQLTEKGTAMLKK